MHSRHPNIRCPIHGSIPLSMREFELIDSPFCQRLRHISQLGFASLVFPGAVHTRFSHSIGVTHLAGRVFDQLLHSDDGLWRHYYSPEQLTYFRNILRFSALLHDLGHMPFSHASEMLLPPLSVIAQPPFFQEQEHRRCTHEDLSYSIIYYLAEEEGLLSLEEAYDIISILSRKLPASERMVAKNGKALIFPLLGQLISGEIDVDRMDYMLRDSYFAGVPYGNFDLDRMINAFSCYLEEKLSCFLLTIDGEAVPTYENFLLARVHMFYQIYFHKSLAVYGYYLNRALKEGEISFTIDQSLDKFLFLTEHSLIEKLKHARGKTWAGKLYRRVPAKNLIRIIDADPQELRQMQEIRRLLTDLGIEVMTTHSANQYSTQIQDGTICKNTILVRKNSFGRIQFTPLAEVSNLLEPKEKMIEIHQLYITREDYKQAIQAIQKLIPTTHVSP